MKWTVGRWCALFTCISFVGGVTLVDETSYLLYQSDGASARSMSLHVRTFVSDCLLTYWDSNIASSDYLVLRIVRGVINLEISSGSEPVEIRSDVRVSDNVWHAVMVSIDSTVAMLTVDGNVVSMNFSSPLRLSSSVYAGGMIAPSHTAYSLPTVGALPQFIGCLDGIKISGVGVTLVSSHGIVSGCADVCESNPCRNGGVCINFYSHFTCQCLSTKFGGSLCEQKSPPVSFQGVEYIHYDAQYSPLPIQPFDLQLILRTTWQDGLIVAALSSQSTHITLTLNDGKLVFLYVVDNNIVAQLNSTYVADNVKHNVRVYRSTNSVNIAIDSVTVSTQTLPPMTSLLVVNRDVFIGGAMLLLLSRPSSSHGFIGCLQQVTVNGIDMTALVSSGSHSISSVGHFNFWCPYEHIVSVNIPDEDSSLVLTDWHNDTLLLSFDVRTLQFHSVLLYSATRYQTQSFEARISNGHLQVTMHDESESEIVIVVIPIDDGRWHCVRISHHASTLVVKVDNKTQLKDSAVAGKVLSALRVSPLFVGSRQAVVGAAVPAQQHRGFSGYRGCVRNLKTNGRNVDVFGLVERSGVRGRVFFGDCEDGNDCGVNRCRNGGRCLRRYDRFECNCTATGYTGTLCQQAIPSDSISLLKSSSSLHSSLPSSSGDTDDSISASFEFRTTTPKGQLISFTHSLSSRPYITLFMLSHDVISLILANSGKTFQLFLEVPSGITDGRWHFVQIGIDSERMGLSVDVSTQVKYFSSELQVAMPQWVFIGRSVSRHVEQPTSSIKGCVRDLTFGLNKVDLNRAIAVSLSSHDVQTGCVGSCSSLPCLHGGRCIEGWGSYTCDCSSTSYTGRLCESAQPSVALQTDSSVTIVFPPTYEPSSFADNIKFGFQAARVDTSGTLLFVHSSTTNQYVLVQVIPGYFITILRLKNGEGVVTIPGNFTDGTEHVVDINRHGAKITIEISGKGTHFQELQGSFSLFEYVDGLVIGGIQRVVSMSNVTASISFQGCIWGLNYNGLQPMQWLRTDTSLQYDGFSFQLKNVVINTCGAMPIPTTPPPMTSSRHQSGVTTDETMQPSEILGPQSGSSGTSMIIIIIGTACGVVITLVLVAVVAYKCVQRRTNDSYESNENRTVSLSHYKETDLPDVTPYDVEGTYAERTSPDNRAVLNGGNHYAHDHRHRRSWNSEAPTSDPHAVDGNHHHGGDHHHGNTDDNQVAVSSARRLNSMRVNPQSGQQEWFL